MKKVLIIVIVFLFYTQTISSMILGSGQLVRCPNCGEDKELMSLASGNTFGALFWSDAYQYAPMLPELSPVQKCPHCNAYFMLSDESPRYIKSEDGKSREVFDTGLLSFQEIKEALLKLENSELSNEDEIVLRMEFLHRFNDAFRTLDPIDLIREKEDKQERNEKDLDLHKDNLIKLITILQNDSDSKEIDWVPLIAELFREAEKYEECLQVLENYQPDDKFLLYYANGIKERAISKNNLVFLFDRSELERINESDDDDENTITIEIGQIEYTE